MANTVRIGTQVTGASKAASEVDRLRDKFTRLQKQSAKGLVLGAGAGLGLAAFNAVGTAVRELTGFVGDATDAFIEDERSQTSLRTALRANIEGWDGNTDAIERMIKARMDLGFSDDEQRESLKGLVAAYGDIDKALQVERTAMDLARFSGTDLAAASDTLIKVHAGNYRALKSLGIETENVTDETEALAAVQKVAAGQAEAFTTTLDGRLTVAAVKNREAMEALGQSTAELQADFGDMAADNIGKFSLGLDFLVDSLNIGNQTLERQIELHEQSIAIMGKSASAEEVALLASLKATKAAADRSDAYEKVSLELRDEAYAAKHAQDPTRGLAKTLSELAAAADDAEEEVDDLASTLEDDLFGDAINAGNEARLKENIKDLKKQRGEVEKGTPKWIELTGEIAENRQKLFELHLEEAKKKGPQAVIDFLEEQKELFKDNKVEVQRLIDKYKALYLIQQKIGPVNAGIRYTGVGGSLPGRAAGGPVSANQAYKVGEHGPETLVMGGQSGTIIPNGGGSSWGGGGLTIIVQGVSVLTPGSADQLARQLVPVITREQQRQGLIPRTR